MVVRTFGLHGRLRVYFLRMSSLPLAGLAAILVEQHAPLVVDTVQLPAELNFGQVLVRLSFSGICGAQIGEIDGAKGADPFLPHLLGHEGSGEVIALGSGVSTVAEGDHVVLHWRPGDGLRGEPPRYRWNGQELNAGWVTTFNEYAVVSEDRITRIPGSFPLDIAPLLGCAVTTAFGVISNDACLKPGESVVVFGAGGVGLSIIQAATMMSAHPMVAVDLFPERLHLARELGATHCITSSTDGAERAIREVLPESVADVCVDTTGNPAVIELAIRVAGHKGRIVLVGVPHPTSAVSVHTLQFHFGKRLTGSHGGSSLPATDIPRLVRLIEAGKLDLGHLITRRQPLHQVNDAITAMRSGELRGRCLLEIGR